MDLNSPGFIPGGVWVDLEFLSGRCGAVAGMEFGEWLGNSG